MARRERGQVLLALLITMIVIAAIGAAYVGRAGTAQRMIGEGYRAVGARYLAEAAVETALSILERGALSEVAVGGESAVVTRSGSTGTFSILSVEPQPAGYYTIIAEGRVGTVKRRLRVIVRLSPRILTYAVFGDRLVHLEGPNARTYVLPDASIPGCVQRAGLGSNREVWFTGPGVTLNVLPGGGLPMHGAPSTAEDAVPVQCVAQESGGMIPGTLILARSASATFGDAHVSAPSAAWLRLQQVNVGLDVVRLPVAEDLPVVDRDVLRGLARANTANAGLNEAVGLRMWRPLLEKRDSLYQPDDFRHLIEYLGRNPSETLAGPVYVTGPIVMPAGIRMAVWDGFLALEGSLTMNQGGRLEVRHSPRSRTFPAVLTLGEEGALVIGEEGMLLADGLVYAERIFNAGEGSIVDIEGALIGADPSLSIRNHNATLIVRYDPIVRGTIGMGPRPGSRRVLAHVVDWEEMR